MKVAVILPSRGLIFSETGDEIMQNVKGIDRVFFFAHRQPIPEAFEKPTNRALLDDSVTHLWYVEDDMVLPPDTLKKMLKMDKAVVTADYPVNKNGRGSVFTVDKRVIFCGTGCLLVKREVFDELKSPYFRTDIRWNIKNYKDFIKITRVKTGEIEGYGLHDVNFCLNLYQKNIPIHALDTPLGQRKLIALGKAGSNKGAHKIETWTKIKKDHLLKTVKSWPQIETGNLVEIITPTGTVNVSKSHARTLVRKGLGKRVPKRKLVVE